MDTIELKAPAQAEKAQTEDLKQLYEFQLALVGGGNVDVNLA